MMYTAAIVMTLLLIFPLQPAAQEKDTAQPENYQLISTFISTSMEHASALNSAAKQGALNEDVFETHKDAINNDLSKAEDWLGKVEETAKTGNGNGGADAYEETKQRIGNAREQLQDIEAEFDKNNPDISVVASQATELHDELSAAQDSFNSIKERLNIPNVESPDEGLL